MQQQFGKAVARASGGKDDALSFMLKLAAGRFKSSPFVEEGLEETRSLIRVAVDMKINEDVVADYLRRPSELHEGALHGGECVQLRRRPAAAEALGGWPPGGSRITS